MIILGLVAALFFIPIGVTQAVGVFEVLPEAIQKGETIAASEIRGSMTIAEAAAALNYNQDEFYKLFQIPESVPAATRMKDIANVVAGYNFHAIKDSLE